ncbi:ParB/RepB/Spo0J family partition protein [Streptomyces sp. NPDC085932]|uniref:ParB/RepB/Spo0J family partition protein n=1 Tax=Streptomyces sp. NPDC085932 TaxID=3365741 RepID=UPI0037CD1B57
MPSPENGRRELLKIDELAATLRSDGMNTAMTVIPPDVFVEIYPQHKELVEAQVARGILFVVHHGHRRLAAALAAGLHEVPILVRREIPSLRIAAIQENLQRMSLNPIEEAHEFQEALDEAPATGKQLSQRELARRVGCSQTYVSHRMSLLRLVPALQQAVIDHWLKEQQLLDLEEGTDDGHCRQLLPVREAATVYARLRPELQEAYVRGELTAAAALLVSKLPADQQRLSVSSIPADGQTDAALDPPSSGLLPEPREGEGTSPVRAPDLPPNRRGAAVAPTAPHHSTVVPEDPRGVIVVRSVEALAHSIRDLLDEAEISELRLLLSS